MFTICHANRTRHCKKNTKPETRKNGFFRGLHLFAYFGNVRDRHCRQIPVCSGNIHRLFGNWGSSYFYDASWNCQGQTKEDLGSIDMTSVSKNSSPLFDNNIEKIHEYVDLYVQVMGYMYPMEMVE